MLLEARYKNGLTWHSIVLNTPSLLKLTSSLEANLVLKQTCSPETGLTMEK